MNSQKISSLAADMPSVSQGFVNHLLDLRDQYRREWDIKYEQVAPRHDEGQRNGALVSMMSAGVGLAAMVAAGSVAAPAAAIAVAGVAGATALASLGKAVYHAFARSRDYEKLDEVYRPSDDVLFVAAQKALRGKDVSLWDRAVGKLAGQAAGEADLVEEVRRVQREFQQ